MKREEILKAAKPILFSTPMVQAIMAGRKTMTRRVVNPQPACYGQNLAYAHETEPSDFFLSAELGHLRCRRCGHDPKWSAEGKDTAHYWKPRHRNGDILYVRETWNADWCDHTIYKADGGSAKAAGYAEEPKWKPSLFMPKEAARIFLKVTDVHVERVQNITDADAIREGCEGTHCNHEFSGYVGGMFACTDCMNTGWLEPPKLEFMFLWDSLNNKRGYGWDTNPWVWVYSFERIKED